MKDRRKLLPSLPDLILQRPAQRFHSRRLLAQNLRYEFSLDDFAKGIHAGTHLIVRETRRQLVTPIILSVAGAAAVWAALHFTAPKPANVETATSMSTAVSAFDSDRWREAVEKVKADRTNPENVAHDIPPELRHYEDRHWFLATQVAEVKQHNIQ